MKALMFFRTILWVIFVGLLTMNIYAQDNSKKVVTQTVQTGIQEVKIKTSAICDECKERIEKAVNKLSGIKSADLDVQTKILTVKYDASKNNPEEIRKTVSKTGYDADNLPANKKAYNRLPKCCQKDGK